MFLRNVVLSQNHKALRPRDCPLHSHRRENLKPKIKINAFSLPSVLLEIPWFWSKYLTGPVFDPNIVPNLLFTSYCESYKISNWEIIVKQSNT
jgi:hypothetical protein